MIKTTQKNLQLGADLLNMLSPAQYRDRSVRPYHASVGNHMRHILDIFDCIFCGLDADGKIDLTARKRNLETEQNIAAGLAYFERTITKLEALKNVDMSRILEVSDDLGGGKITAPYTLAAILIQAHSHAIHHYASIGYILSELGIDMPADVFGYNPTTPKENRAVNMVAI